MLLETSAVDFFFPNVFKLKCSRREMKRLRGWPRYIGASIPLSSPAFLSDALSAVFLYKIKGRKRFQNVADGLF